MKIAIIGAGNVGGALGRGFVRSGHEVIYGVRDPSLDRHAALKGESSSVRGIQEAVRSAEVALLATPWAAAKQALEAAGDFEGKVLIDATNPIGPGFSLTHGHTDSGAEQVARWAPGARVVKAFNTTGVENMADPRYGETSAAMFVCGDDAEAVDAAMTLAGDLGFDAVRAGKLEAARLLEPMALVWIRLAIVEKMGRGFAFGLLRR